MSKSIFLRRSFSLPLANTEYFINWENDTLIPLSLDAKTKVGMYTNGATRISITLDTDWPTNINVYVDSVSYNLWSDFMVNNKIVCSSLFPGLSIVAGSGRVFIAAECTFECMKIGIEGVGDTASGSILVVGWNEMGNP